MKPAGFEIVTPRTLSEALTHLREGGDEARVIAGGQSLGPLLNLRMARPSTLVDVTAIPELTGLEVNSDGTLRIGATVSQRSVETSQRVQRDWPMLAAAVSEIGHRAIRNRGTIGGSAAHADPAAEIPAVLVALDAVLELDSSSGSRQVNAADFFLGPFTTSLQPGEILREIHMPRANRGSAHTWLEFSRRHGDFALVGVAASLEISGGVITNARLVYSGVHWTPWECLEAKQMLIGANPGPDLFLSAGQAAAEASSPPSDIHAASHHRKRLIATLTGRALMNCAVELRNGGRS